MSVDAVIYVARSKDEEAGKDSTGDQVAAITRRLREIGDRAVVGESYTDHASGYKGNRGPGLESAISAAAAAAPCELWVFHSSRLARGSGMKDEARSLMEVLTQLRRQGVTVRSVEDDPFTTEPMLWGVADQMAHKYSKDMAAHIRKGKRAASASGRWPGGPVPDGYRLSASFDPASGKRRLEEDPERAPIIRRMFELRLAGLNFAEIARELNGAGHRTLARATAGGVPFTHQRVKQMLGNPIYAARVGEVPGNWPALVDPAVFDRVAVKARVRANETKRGRAPTQFVLGSLAVCDECGRPMTGGKRGYVRKDGSQQRYYQCTSSKVSTGTCKAVRLDADRIDEAIRTHLDHLFIDFEAWVAEQASMVARQQDALKAELGAARKELAKRQKQREIARERYVEKQTLAREDALEHVVGKVKAAQEQVDAAEARIAKTDDGPQNDAMLDVYNSLRRTLLDDTASLNQRLRRVFSEFRIGLVDDGRTIAILPVLMPDVIEQHGDVDGLVKVVGEDGTKLIAPLGDSEASPVMLLVTPPAKHVRVSLTDTNVHPSLSVGS